jgi:choline dehydrogenase-like flavoprotein
MFGGYFSSVSSTLPWASKTGNLTIQPDSVVHSIIYDEKKKRATGVKVIDALTHQETEYYAHIIFLNASALNSNLILLNSTSSRFPRLQPKLMTRNLHPSKRPESVPSLMSVLESLTKPTEEKPC